MFINDHFQNKSIREKHRVNAERMRNFSSCWWIRRLIWWWIRDRHQFACWGVCLMIAPWGNFFSYFAQMEVDWYLLWSESSVWFIHPEKSTDLWVVVVWHSSWRQTCECEMEWYGNLRLDCPFNISLFLIETVNGIFTARMYHGTVTPSEEVSWTRRGLQRDRLAPTLKDF